MTPTGTPIKSVEGIEALVAFGLQIFLAIFGALKHPTAPLPPAQVPALVAALATTPGMGADHQTVLTTMATAAATAATAPVA